MQTSPFRGSKVHLVMLDLLCYNPYGKGEGTMKKCTRNILLSIAICVIVFWMFFFILLDPYQDWDQSLKLIDDDKMLVLILFWAFITLANLSFTVFTWKYKKWFAAYLMLTLFGIVKFLTYFVYAVYLR